MIKMSVNLELYRKLRAEVELTNDIKQTQVHIEDPEQAAINLERLMREINEKHPSIVGKKFRTFNVYKLSIIDGMLHEDKLFSLDIDESMRYNVESYEEQVSRAVRGENK